MLEDGRNFRVRTRAAVALGGSRDPRHVPALVRALHRDPHPAVRLAAIAALCELGSPAGRHAIELASRRDRSKGVRGKAIAALRGWRPAASGVAPDAPRQTADTAHDGAYDGPGRPNWRRVRHVVVVGDVSNQSGRFGGALIARAKRQLRRELGGRPTVAVIELGSSDDSEAADRGLPRYRIETNVSAVDRTVTGGQMSVRCNVSIILMDEPGRSMRSVMRAGATSMGAREGDLLGQERKLAAVALDRALQVAVRNAFRALKSAETPVVLLGNNG